VEFVNEAASKHAAAHATFLTKSSILQKPMMILPDAIVT
jgi:hypothetical protein